MPRSGLHVGPCQRCCSGARNRSGWASDRSSAGRTVLYSSSHAATARRACSRVPKWLLRNSSNSTVELNDSAGGVIQGRAGAAHRLGDPGPTTGLHEDLTGVLTALVGMEHHPGHRATADRDRHTECRPGQLGVVVGAHGEPDASDAAVSLATLIAAQRAEHGIPAAVSCRALGVSQAWFHKWRTGDRSPRRKRRTALAATITYLFTMARFAPVRPARGAMFAARRRAGRSEPSTVEPVITEAEYYPG